MTRRKDPASAEFESRVQTALADLSKGLFPSIRKAASAYNIPRSTLCARLKGRKSRVEGHEDQQLLTAHEEFELVRWITHLTKTGYPVQHSELLSMAKEIQQQRVRKVNNECELVSYPPIGKEWTKRFLSRHPELQTVQGKAIDANRIQGATHEAINKWFNAYEETVRQYQISPENEANMDESGFSIGKIEATRVIINKLIRQKLQAQPGKQEWVSAIEYICADGTAIPPLIIFKGENLNSQWMSLNVPLDWKFSCNSKGWTSNKHGIEWLKRCYEPFTRERANGGYRLLILDGHGSHITGEFIGFCIQNKIVLMVLPPHTSHMTQPLDVGIFSPLKKYMAAELHSVYRTGIIRMQKAEWLDAYVRAREQAFSSTNIQSAFLGAGLRPVNRFKVLSRLSELSSTPPPQLSQSTEEYSALDIVSSPIDRNAYHKANQEMFRQLDNNQTIQTPVRRHIKRVANELEKLSVRTNILETEVKSLKTVITKRREQTTGTRTIIKGKHVLSNAEIHAQIVENEQRSVKRRRKSIATPNNDDIDPALFSVLPHPQTLEGIVSNNMSA